MYLELPRLQFTVYTKMMTKKIQLGGYSGPDCVCHFLQCEIKKKAYSILHTKLCYKN